MCRYAVPNAWTCGVAREEIQPQRRRDRDDDADRAGDRRHHRRAEPGHAQGALHLPGTHVGRDQCRERRAEAEGDRHQDVFEPRRHAVAGERRDAVASDQCRRHGDRHVADDRAQRRRETDAQQAAQQIGTQAPAHGLQPQRGRRPRQPHEHDERCDRVRRPACSPPRRRCRARPLILSQTIRSQTPAAAPVQGGSLRSAATSARAAACSPRRARCRPERWSTRSPRRPRTARPSRRAPHRARRRARPSRRTRHGRSPAGRA